MLFLLISIILGQAEIIHTSLFDTVYSGDNVTFTCLFSNPGRPSISTYSWSVNGITVPHVNDQFLVLESISRGETEISCNGRNAAGWGTGASKNMTILKGPSFTQTLPPHTNVLDTVDSILLTCEASREC